MAKIFEDLENLTLNDQNLPMEDPNSQNLIPKDPEFIWYFCDFVIKGFRDPQVGVATDPF